MWLYYYVQVAPDGWFQLTFRESIWPKPHALENGIFNFSHWSKRGCIKGNNSDNNNWNKQHLAIPWALYYIKQYNIISTLSGTSSSSVMLTDQIIQYFWKLCALGTTKSPKVNSGQRLSESHVNDVWCQWCLCLIFLVLWCRRKCVTKLILMCTVIRSL